jgi:hypothetical protein
MDKIYRGPSGDRGSMVKCWYAMASPIAELAIFPVISGLISVYCGATGYSNYVAAVATRHWRSTEGTVLSSEVEEVVRNTGKGARFSYRPRIRYQYTVDSTTHEGERIFFGAENPNSWTPGSAREIVGLYSPGAKCRVFVDPERAEETVLRRETTAAMHMLLVSAATGIVTIIFLFAIFR